jgi:hypothetical protein
MVILISSVVDGDSHVDCSYCRTVIRISGVVDGTSHIEC